MIQNFNNDKNIVMTTGILSMVVIPLKEGSQDNKCQGS